MRAGLSIETLLEGLTLPKGQILYVHARLRGVEGSVLPPVLEWTDSPVNS